MRRPPPALRSSPRPPSLARPPRLGQQQIEQCNARSELTPSATNAEHVSDPPSPIEIVTTHVLGALNSVLQDLNLAAVTDQ